MATMMILMIMAMMRVERLLNELQGYCTVLQMVKMTDYWLIQIESQNNGTTDDDKCVGLDDNNNNDGDSDD